jgi:CDP-diacylglycerol--serine O-phosphatidyltransferase
LRTIASLMSVTRHIPNALTCGNLLCGCLGIVGLFEHWNIPSAYFVWAACVFDFFDGFAARALKANSPIGRELDSLADMVSFGVLPSMVMYFLMRSATEISWVPPLAFLLVIFSALRLAQFNIDDRQHDGFIGLPTPANALLITGLPLLAGTWVGSEWNITFLLATTVVFSWLMVSPLPLLALKFKHMGWKSNELRFTLLGISVLLLAILGQGAIVLVIIIYLLLSLVGRWWGEGAVSSK